MTTKEILTQAVTAKNAINSADTKTKNKALANMADALLAHTDAILEANKQDVEAARGKIIFGICGGYQMLGQRVDDPEGAEGGGSQEGLGLLPVATRFSREKTRTRTAKTTVQTHGTVADAAGVLHGLSGLAVEGYEIHMGDSGPEGLFSVRENVLGTYLHGFFDTPELRDRLVSLLLARRGLTWTGETGDEDGQAYREEQYDKLAAALRASLDLEAVYRILEQGLD